mmetsp:Transcript_141507/g.368728  ORF Transcript_141507/g.368728 Transcript_141507/m.368728 type:complete len:385 (+) Transcript_141507:1583-2737(+)
MAPYVVRDDRTADGAGRDDIERKGCPKVGHLMSLGTKDYSGGQGHAHRLKQVGRRATNVRNVLADCIQVIDRMHRGKGLLHLLFDLCSEHGLLVGNEADLRFVHVGVRIDDLLPLTMGTVFFTVAINIVDVVSLFQGIHRVHVIIIDVLPQHRRDKVGTNVAALGEDASSNAGVEGDDGHPNAESYQGIRLFEDDPSRNHAHQRHRVRTETPDCTSSNGKCDAACQVVVHGVRQAGPTLEVHVDPHVYTAHASRRPSQHGQGEADVRHEENEARDGCHDHHRDRHRAKQVAIHTFVDDIAEILHAMHTHVLHKQLAAEVSRGEEAEGGSQYRVEEHEGRHCIPEGLADLAAGGVSRLPDEAPRRDIPRRGGSADVRNLFRDQRS